VLILFTSGEGLRSDFKAAFDKSAKEDTSGKIVYARVDPVTARLSPALQRWREADIDRLVLRSESRAVRNPGERSPPGN